MENCSPMTITYIAGLFTILGVLIGALLFHQLAKKRETSSTRNGLISGYIATITQEIQRIDTEKYTSPHPIGTVAIIESILPQIEELKIDIEAQWKEFHENEHKRTSVEGEKKPKAVKALQSIIKILNENKT